MIRKSLSRVGREELGIESMQAVLIMAIAAVILTAVKNQWPTVKGHYIVKVEAITAFDGSATPSTASSTSAFATGPNTGSEPATAAFARMKPPVLRDSEEAGEVAKKAGFSEGSPVLSDPEDGGEVEKKLPGKRTPQTVTLKRGLTTAMKSAATKSPPVIGGRESGVATARKPPAKVTAPDLKLSAPNPPPVFSDPEDGDEVAKKLPGKRTPPTVTLK